MAMFEHMYSTIASFSMAMAPAAAAITWGATCGPIDDSTQHWDETPQRIGSNVEEFCLGAQAHTHYFDADNNRIGERLDRLIGQ
jgi:hypothetical protein